MKSTELPTLAVLTLVFMLQGPILQVRPNCSRGDLTAIYNCEPSLATARVGNASPITELHKWKTQKLFLVW